MPKLKPVLYTLPAGVEVISEYPPTERLPYWKLRVRPHRLVVGSGPGITVIRARLLMAIELDRPLTDEEQVHHVNGDRQDDRTENLQVLSVSQHRAVHNSGAGPKGRDSQPLRPTKSAKPVPPLSEQAAFVRVLGGAHSVARMVARRTGIDLTAQAVDMWRKRGIPYRYRAALAIEARERNIGVPDNFLGEQIPEPTSPPVDQVQLS